MSEKTKTPIDANQRGKFIVEATVNKVSGFIKETTKDPNAAALGSKGGKSRAKNLTPEKRTEIARNAAKKRWNR